MKIRATVLMFSTLFGMTLGTATAPKAQTRATDTPVADDAAQTSEPAKTSMVRDLDAEMARNGRVALPALHAEGTAILMSAALVQNSEMKVRTIPAVPLTKAVNRISLRDVPNLDLQYGKAFAGAVEGCRYSVARQSGTTPGQIAAGVVTYSWTVEPSGRVRDITAIAGSTTDAAVLSCVKRLIAGRLLLNPVSKPLALEWTYAFRPLPIVTPALLAAQQVTAER